MSIWDMPQAAEQTTDTTTTAPSTGAPAAPMTGAKDRVYGTQAGPLLSGKGRGIVDGVPYGETEQARVEALNAQYPFDPGYVAKARAATRQALGR